MSSWDAYIIKYHHGGTLLKEGHVIYVNGAVNEFVVDPDKLCYWDLLGDVKKIGYDIEKEVNLSFIDGEGTINSICDDQSLVGLAKHLSKQRIVDIYVETTKLRHCKELPGVVLCNIGGDVEKHGQKVNDIDSDSSTDHDERLASVPFIDYNSDKDEEIEEARDKVLRYAKMKKKCMEDNDVHDTSEEGDGRQHNNAEEGPNLDTYNLVDPLIGCGKVMGYDSDYFVSSDPGSYEDTSQESDADDANRHKSKDIYYDPNAPLEDFYLDLRFDDLKLFKRELVDFSLRKGFEFQYLKNDGVRVRVRCAAKGCKWLIFCSWCSRRKMYVVKTYVREHSCFVGTSKNKRVTGSVIARRYFDVINGMPCIRPRHLRALLRKDLGVFISTKVCRNAKAMVLKKMEKQYQDEFLVLNNYILELKEANPGSTVSVVAERKNGVDLPVFQKIYICISAIKEGFSAGCRKIVGLDGCFLKGLVKGQLLVAVGRDGNNQMFPIAWAVVEKETTESWDWFIQHLQADLQIGDGLGWALISDMQKVKKQITCVFFNSINF